MAPNLDDAYYKKNKICETLFPFMENKNYEMVRVLLDLLEGQGENIYYKNDDETMTSPFEYAVDLENEELLDILITYVEPDYRVKLIDGKNIMHYACEKNRPIALCTLIHNLFDAEILDSERQTPLHYCARFDSRDACNYLIKCKVELNEPDINDDTPLLMAYKHRNYEIVRMLGAKRRCNLNAKDKNGRSVLLLACIDNNLDMVKWLVANDADIDTYDLENLTPLIVAHYTNICNQEMYAVLCGTIDVQHLNVRPKPKPKPKSVSQQMVG